MNKFVKYGTIFGCVFVLGGAGATTAALALGADMREIGQFFEEKILHRYDTDYGYHGSYGNEAPVTGPAVSETAVEMTVPVDADQTTNGLGEYRYIHSFSTVTDLEIKITNGYVETYTDANLDELMVMSDNEIENHLRFSDTERYQKLEVRLPENEFCRIGIPAEWNLNSLEVEVKNGQFNGEVPEVREAEFTAHGGEIQVLQNEGQYTDIECLSGFINWSGKGEKTRTMDVECGSVGMVEIELIDYPEPEHIGYDVEYEDARIEFYGTVWEGYGNVNRRAENGMAYMELDAEAGGAIMIR